MVSVALACAVVMATVTSLSDSAKMVFLLCEPACLLACQLSARACTSTTVLSRQKVSVQGGGLLAIYPSVGPPRVLRMSNQSTHHEALAGSFVSSYLSPISMHYCIPAVLHSSACCVVAVLSATCDESMLVHRQSSCPVGHPTTSSENHVCGRGSYCKDTITTVVLSYHPSSRSRP